MTKKEMKKKQQLEKKLIKNVSTNDESSEIKKIIFIILGILAVLAIFYFVGGLITGEIKLSKKKYTVEEAKIQYEEILVGTALNQSSDMYYVILCDFNDTNTNVLKATASKYTEGENANNIYYVDMSNSFNKDAIATGETSASNYAKITNGGQLKIAQPTLIKVTNKKITEYIESFDSVNNYLEKLVG